MILQKSQDTEEEYGWEAAKKSLISDSKEIEGKFAENLLSKEEGVYEEACLLVEKFMTYLKKQCEQSLKQKPGSERSGIEETTVITYPTGFGKREQEVIKKAAEKAGFENVVVQDEVDELEAAEATEAVIRYALRDETGEMVKWAALVEAKLQTLWEEGIFGEGYCFYANCTMNFGILLIKSCDTKKKQFYYTTCTIFVPCIFGYHAQKYFDYLCLDSCLCYYDSKEIR